LLGCAASGRRSQVQLLPGVVRNAVFCRHVGSQRLGRRLFDYVDVCQTQSSIRFLKNTQIVNNEWCSLKRFLITQIAGFRRKSVIYFSPICLGGRHSPQVAVICPLSVPSARTNDSTTDIRKVNRRKAQSSHHFRTFQGQPQKHRVQRVCHVKGLVSCNIFFFERNCMHPDEASL